MKIKITLENEDGELVEKGEALSFESAEELLGKMARRHLEIEQENEAIRKQQHEH